MKICLINPPSVFLLDERVFPSLGILKVAAVLEPHHHVDVLDLNGIENYCEALSIIGSYEAVGITTTTPQLPATMKILTVIRSLAPRLRVILGGPHVTLSYSAMKVEKKLGITGRGHEAVRSLEQSFDVLVSGDGEMAVFEALKPDAPKMIDGDDHKGPLFMSDASYEASPFPARHLIDLDSYHYSIEGRRATSLIAQLGCPFFADSAGAEIARVCASSALGHRMPS